MERSSGGAGTRARRASARPTKREELHQQHDLVVTGGPWPELEGESQTMIINMGPQHPSTHGVLRLMMELDGETVVRAKPVVGYLHTGMEKTGEELTYVQGATNVTRMDYAAPLSNELVWATAVEQLLDVEVPPRGVGADDAPGARPHRLAPALPGHERHGHRRGLDAALRLARARRGAAPARADHRPADEPQLHPPGWESRPTCPTAGRRRCSRSATSSRPASRTTTRSSPRTRSGSSAWWASASSRRSRRSRSA